MNLRRLTSSRGHLITLNRSQTSLRLGGCSLFLASRLRGITSIRLRGYLRSQPTSLRLTLNRSLVNPRRLTSSRADLITLNRPQTSLRLDIASHRLRSLSQLLGITSIRLRGYLLSQLTSLRLTLNRSLVNLRRLTSSRGHLITLNRPQTSLRLDIASHRLRSLS